MTVLFVCISHLENSIKRQLNVGAFHNSLCMPIIITMIWCMQGSLPRLCQISLYQYRWTIGEETAYYLISENLINKRWIDTGITDYISLYWIKKLANYGQSTHFTKLRIVIRIIVVGREREQFHGLLSNLFSRKKSP